MLFPKREEYRSAKLLKSSVDMNQHSSIKVKHTKKHKNLYIYIIWMFWALENKNNKNKNSKLCFLYFFPSQNGIGSVRRMLSDLQKKIVGALGMQTAWVGMENLWKIVSILIE